VDERSQPMIELLAPREVRRRWPSGHRLFSDGDEVCGVFVIHSGEVELLLSTRNGEPRTLRASGPGQILGISGLMSGRPHDCTAVTRRPSVIGYVSKDDFMAAVDQQSGAWLAVLHLLSEDINVSYENLRAIAAHH